jgi:hypothetical protein
MPKITQQPADDKTVVTIMPKSESSVEISTNSKGEAQLTIKIYAEDPREALDTALRLYEMGQNHLRDMKEKTHA